MNAMPESWPHFMERGGRHKMYRSRKALGSIYNKVVQHSVRFEPD
jgi:hypothetical protein